MGKRGKTLWCWLERPTGTKGAAYLCQHGGPFCHWLVFPAGTKGGLKHRVKYPVSEATIFGFTSLVHVENQDQIWFPTSTKELFSSSVYS